METAEIFLHRGGQAVRLPERRGDEVVLKPLRASQFQDFETLAAHLAEKYPDAADFPDPPPRPKLHERPAPEF
jgi:hypothetical protein